MIESFNEYYLILYWMLLLLLLKVNNTKIKLMALLNAIDRKNRWSLYMAMLLPLLLANDKKPTQFVVMAWNRWCDLASWFFSKAVVKDKTIGRYCHNTSQHQLGFSICCTPHQLLLYHVLRKISSCANLVPESLNTVCVSGTLQGAQVPDAHCPVTNKVNCNEECYSFTNQAFVLWHLGACQEWWQLLARSTRSAWWCANMMFLLSLLQSTTLIVAWHNMSTLLHTMTTQSSLTNTFVVMAVAKGTVSTQALWRLIAMVRGHDSCNQFNCEHFGAFTIVEGCGPVTHCGKGLVLSLYGVRVPKVLCGKRLIVILHDVHDQSLLWQGACCCTQPSCHPWQGVRHCLLWQEACCGSPRRMHPPRHSCCTSPWCCTCHLWHTPCTCLRQCTCLF